MNNNLDLLDRKVLFSLDEDSRQPFAKIANEVHSNKQVVAYRTQRLSESGIVKKFMTILDTSKIGFTTYKILLRLQNTSKEKEIEIIDYLQTHKQVQWFASTYGNYDLAFNILSKNVQELYGELRSLKKRFTDNIAEIAVNIMVLANFYPRQYLLPEKNSSRKTIKFGSAEEKIDLDQTDKEILSTLCANSRTQNTEIASKTSVSPDTIRLRIKALEKKGVIQGYSIVPNSEALGQLEYKVLFSMHNLSPEREKAFDAFISNHPNACFSSKGIGMFDFEANIEVASGAEYRQFLFQVREKFSDVIKSYNTLQTFKVHKFNFYPMGI